MLCPTCEGEGTIAEPFCDCAWNCGGRYCGSDDVPCPECNGAGTVVVEPEHVDVPDGWSDIFNEAIKVGMGLAEARDWADRKAAENERAEQ